MKQVTLRHELVRDFVPDILIWASLESNSAVEFLSAAYACTRKTELVSPLYRMCSKNTATLWNLFSSTPYQQCSKFYMDIDSL